MFERFTRQARLAVMAAVDEAEARGESHVGTEHVLVGIAAIAPALMPEHSAADLRAGLVALDGAALEAVGVDLADRVRLGPGPGRKQRLRFTHGAREVLEEALREGVRLRHRHLGPEHMLLAITRRPSTDAAWALLVQLAVDPERLRADLLTDLESSA